MNDTVTLPGTGEKVAVDKITEYSSVDGTTSTVDMPISKISTGGPNSDGGLVSKQNPLDVESANMLTVLVEIREELRRMNQHLKTISEAYP